MSHFGRSGPPDISGTVSLLVLNITFRTTQDDLYSLFAKYGKVVDIFIPRDRRTGDSRGFAFVRYKLVDEAEKAIERLDGRNVDGRDIVVQFAKYGPNAEGISKGRVTKETVRQRSSRSRSPRRSRYRDDEHRYRNDRYREREYQRRSRSRSRDRYDRYRDHHEKDYRRPLSRSVSRSRSSSRDNSRLQKRSQSRSPERKDSLKEKRSVDRHRSPSPDHRYSSSPSPSPRKRASDKSKSPVRSVSRSCSRDSRSPSSDH